MSWIARLASLAVFALLAAGQGGAGTQELPGVANSAQAQIDYMLKCQGCHQPGGTGNNWSSPPLNNAVARFLAVPGGREFLGRVPGVATTDLDDHRLAELLNWTLYRFDAGHIPAGFKPYSAAEVGRLRKAPLRLDLAETRARLIAAIGDPSMQ